MAERAGVAGIVLAAGLSSRMGSNKMLLELDGESLIARAARRAIHARLNPVIVVVGHEADRARGALAGVHCVVVENPDFRSPSSASMHRGLDAVPAESAGAVALLGDMVHVSADMIRAVAEAAGTSGAPLVVSHYGDVTAPPIYFARALFEELRAWTGEGCGKPVVRAHIHEAHIVDWPEASLADVDTPADWDRLAR
ncbi:MAG TPA: nucleotidyltransferase family protein [Gemmatimonadaceae bacterium]|nr:nucleotidyltransferase family protein [Gemmatimonadaceae bacterium]